MLAALPDAARRYLEAQMSTHTFEFQSDYARRLDDGYRSFDQLGGSSGDSARSRRALRAVDQ
ncbi:hypothetical protein Athai_57400 [Actinocatenispora thailandica]|uniref:Uncharacterized protein n=1 Tax=Actinocatenispora thailandica TaxID=227318 RepID=A0A7R7DVQ5_9ACTN|nr:hypothetical protein Athai_57400 [Actinocatenispora thailandica]